MATVVQGARQRSGKQWRSGLKSRARRSWLIAGGAGLGALALLSLVALVSYHPSDPSLNTAAAGPVRNWLGAPGAWVADLLLSLWGPPAALLLPLVALIGFRIARGAGRDHWLRSIGLSVAGIMLIGGAAALLVGEAVNGLPAGWGGALGFVVAYAIDSALGLIGDSGIIAPFRVVAMGLCLLGGLSLAWFGLGLREEEKHWIAALRDRRLRAAEPQEDYSDIEERPARAAVAAPAPNYCL
jgi:S-DNA-T family DNA segregation ATPase FtsK/SpoIIIE